LQTFSQKFRAAVLPFPSLLSPRPPFSLPPEDRRILETPGKSAKAREAPFRRTVHLSGIFLPEVRRPSIRVVAEWLALLLSDYASHGLPRELLPPAWTQTCFPRSLSNSRLRQRVFFSAQKGLLFFFSSRRTGRFFRRSWTLPPFPPVFSFPPPFSTANFFHFYSAPYFDRGTFFYELTPFLSLSFRQPIS